MTKRKRATGAEIKARIDGGDALGVVGAQHVVIETQNFFGGTPVAQHGDDEKNGSPIAHIGTLTLVRHVPYPRNPHFTGRSEVIARLQEELQSGQAAAVTQAIAGLGGIGKTQLALEYCYRQAASYQVVWWIRAESKETRIADLAALAERLKLTPVGKSDLSSSAAAVIEWLDRTPGWLLVFDNVERPEDLEHLLPVAGRGHVLITSRHAAWGARAKTVRLNVWTSEESTQYLLRRTDEDSTEANKRAATALAEVLGQLPLAIEQAAAYIEESKIGIATYTEMFEKQQLRLFEPRRAQPPRDQRTIATVWDISLRSVERASLGAVALLQLCAFMRPDRISKQEIENHYSVFPEPLKSTASNQIALHDAIATLRRYSLVDATSEFISVHRLVQLVVRDRLDPRDYRAFHEIADRVEHESSDSSLNVESGWDQSRSQFERDGKRSTASANEAANKKWLRVRLIKT
jgi:NB-ARC domain